MELTLLQKCCNELSTFSEWKILSFIMWTYFYLTVKIKYPNRSPEWATRVIAFVHGTAATLSGLALCGRPKCEDEFFSKWHLQFFVGIYFYGWTQVIRTKPHHSLSKRLLCCVQSAEGAVRRASAARIGIFHYMLMVWSWGYFAFDLLWCLLYWPTQFTMLGHHVCTLLAISMYMNKQYSGCVFPSGLALMEATNPLLQTRWFLREEGMGKTNIFFFIELAYFLLFISLRAGVGTYIILRAIVNPKITTDEKILFLGLYAISLALLIEVLGYVYYRFKKEIVSYLKNIPTLKCTR